MRHFFIIISLLFVCESIAQNLQWGFSHAGQGTQFSKVIKQRNELVYILGVFTDPFDADPGPNTFMLTSSGAHDAYLAIYDTDGNFISAQAIGGSGNESGVPGMAIDPYGNLHLTLEFENTIDLDPSPTVQNVTSTGGTDCLVAKYDSLGNFISAFQLDVLTADSGNGIAADSTAVYVTGSFSGTVDFDPGPSNFSLAAPIKGIYVGKYSHVGALIWAFHIENQSVSGTGNAIRIDSLHNVILAGYFYGTDVDFDPGPGQALMTQNSNLFDFFLAKYSSDGSYLWAHHNGGILDNAIYTLELSGTEIIAGGFIQGTSLDLDPGAPVLPYNGKGFGDAYLARFDENGNLLWANAYGASQYDDIIGLTLTPDGDIVVTGGFSSDTVVVQTGDTLFAPISDNNFDAYVAQFSPTGNLKWHMVFGDSLWDQGSSIVADAYNNWYVLGVFGRRFIDIDPSPNSFLLNGVQGQENVIFKLSPCARMAPDLPDFIQVKEDALVNLPCEVAAGTPQHYSWYKNDILLPDQNTSTLQFSVIAFADEGEYRVKVRDACYNSKWSDTLELDVLPTLKVYQLISPNGDEHNEFFFVRNIELEDFRDHEITILNRWGQKVFESTQYKNDWDGGNLVDGTYYYFLKTGNEEFKGKLIIKR